jgi:hypothetical protein
MNSYDLDALLMAALLTACTPGGAPATSDGDSDGSGGSGGALDPSQSGGGGSGFELETTTGSGGSGAAVVTPVRLLPGLESITFYEVTGTTQAYTFALDGPELSHELADPLGAGTGFDISGATSEYYDVYFSDADGVFDVDGSYLTISGVFDLAAPAGAGLNLGEIGLDYAGSTEYGNYVASFVALGDNALPADVDHCIDGDLNTYTTMGNTVSAKSFERLRLTLGFLSSSGPPPQ